MCNMHTRYRLFYLSIVDTPSGVDAYNIAKQQNIHCVAFSLKFHWCGSMEWNMEENFSMEWIMKWKIFSMEWKWNGRKLPEWNMEKSSSIPYHALLAYKPTPKIRILQKLGCKLTLPIVTHQMHLKCLLHLF